MQGRQNSGRAGGGVKKLRAMVTYKKNLTNYAYFCSTTMLTSEIIKETIEKFVSIPP